MSNVRALARAPAVARGLGAPTRAYRIEVGDTIVETSVHEYPTHVLVPLSVDLADGGHLRGMFEIDRQTFDRAVQWSEQRGLSFVRLAAIAERALGGASIFSLDERRILPR